MIERSGAKLGETMRRTALLGIALMPLAGCGELDLMPKLRDYYMGQQFFEPELFSEKTLHNPDGEPLVGAEAAIETTEPTDTVEAP
jgi:hypothetical protein